MKTPLSLVLTSVLASSSAVYANNNEMMVAAGKKLFEKECSACHSTDSSVNAFGPSLVGVVGREAAALPRYAYSDALSKSGITWDEASLRKWLAGNDSFVPNTRMRHVEYADQAQQDYIIAFLKSLK